jgi:hypothetical protein
MLPKPFEDLRARKLKPSDQSLLFHFKLSSLFTHKAVAELPSLRIFFAFRLSMIGVRTAILQFKSLWNQIYLIF